MRYRIGADVVLLSAMAAHSHGVVVLGSKPNELDVSAHATGKRSPHSRRPNWIRGWLCPAIHWARGLPTRDAAETRPGGRRFGSGVEHLRIRHRSLLNAGSRRRWGPVASPVPQPDSIRPPCRAIRTCPRDKRRPAGRSDPSVQRRAVAAARAGNPSHHGGAPRAPAGNSGRWGCEPRALSLSESRRRSSARGLALQ